MHKSIPENVNVSVAMSLAAGQYTDVELWVDPAVDRNVHELFVEGDFGETYVKVTISRALTTLRQATWQPFRSSPSLKISIVR